MSPERKALEYGLKKVLVTLPMQEEFRDFFDKFTRTPRIKREHILCAMIRVNYGTPWEGDAEILQEFFPVSYHSQLCLGGLTPLIEAFNPFADEPTNYSPVPQEPTEKSGTLTFVRYSADPRENTTSLSEITTDLPQESEETSTIKLPMM